MHLKVLLPGIYLKIMFHLTDIGRDFAMLSGEKSQGNFSRISERIFGFR
jgi:hypothetical protein